MPEFQTMFIRSKGQPIEWQGKKLVLHDNFPTLDAKKYRLTFELCNGTWREGVIMALLHKDSQGNWQAGAGKGQPGHFTINGQTVNGRDGTVIWQDSAPPVIEFEITGGAPIICVYNVWQATTHVTIPGTTGRPVVDSGHNGAAMIVEELSNGRRYRCNDGEPDEDFDDIVFRLERIE
jgi:hypothetical protein